MMPCEFRWFEDCPQTFALDDTEAWISHIIRDHLRDKLPRACACWFCDKFSFNSDDKRVGDRNVNFYNRMHHIRSHYMTDKVPMRRIRPDFHMVEHLRKHRLITERTYNDAKNWHEIASFPNLYPAGWRPPLTERQQSDAYDLEAEERERRRAARRSGKASKVY